VEDRVNIYTFREVELHDKGVRIVDGRYRIGPEGEVIEFSRGSMCPDILYVKVDFISYLIFLYGSSSLVSRGFIYRLRN